MSVIGQGVEVAPPTIYLPPRAKQLRWTVLLRLILFIPVAIWNELITLCAIVVFIAAWVAGVITGSVPEPLGDFLFAALNLQLRANAYLFFLIDRFPPYNLFEVGDYPVWFELDTATLSRTKILVRPLLAIPALIVSQVCAIGMATASIITWVTTVVRQESPTPLFEANSAVIRFQVRTWAYFALLTSSYPSGLLGEGVAARQLWAAIRGHESFAHHHHQEPQGLQASSVHPVTLAARRIVVAFGAVGLAVIIVLNLFGGGSAPAAKAGTAPLQATTTTTTPAQSLSGNLKTLGDDFALAGAIFNNSFSKCRNEAESLPCEQSAYTAFATDVDRFAALVQGLKVPAADHSLVQIVAANSEQFAQTLRAIVATGGTGSQVTGLVHQLEDEQTTLSNSFQQLVRAIDGN